MSSEPRKPILRVSSRGTEFASVSLGDVPIELTPTLAWSGGGSVIDDRVIDDRVVVMTDSAGAETYYDFASAAAASRCAAFSIRVGPGYVVQTDCILGNPDVARPEDFQSGLCLGLRLQPFFLPESGFDAASLVGRGLFGRGLHYSGSVTPGNVSLLCICDGCHKTFRLQSFHAGFAQLAYFYCSSGYHTLVVDAAVVDAAALDGAALLPSASVESRQAFESRLPPCERCSGSFRYWNSLRCPHCRSPYIDFEKYPDERPREYYGNHLYGEAVQRWSPAG